MSEFLMLGWNVAIPEVDIGDDIFVVQDDNGTLRKVQVKTSQSKARKKGFSGQFSISQSNLALIGPIQTHFVFVVRNGNQWTQPIIIKQDNLLDFVENKGVGSKSHGKITLYFSYVENGAVKSAGQDLTPYFRDFTDFPMITH